MSLVWSRCRRHSRHCKHLSPTPQHNPAHSGRRHGIIHTKPCTIPLSAKGASVALDEVGRLEQSYTWKAFCLVKTIGCQPCCLCTIWRGIGMAVLMKEPLWCTITATDASANLGCAGSRVVAGCCGPPRQVGSHWAPAAI